MRDAGEAGTLAHSVRLATHDPTGRTDLSMDAPQELLIRATDASNRIGYSAQFGSAC